MEIFHRPELAKHWADQVLYTGVSAVSSGLFVFAPRRTGKSTFIREDLRPALQAKGALVIYVDLWKDPHADPGWVIVAAIQAALKAARDELNSSAHFGIRILCTGSNQNKIAMLRDSKDQAFFLAPTATLPTLEKAFVAWFCQRTDLGAELNAEKVWPLFVEAGYKPEALNAAVNAMQLEFDANPTPETVFNRFSAAIRRPTEEAKKGQLKLIRTLASLQQAVLYVMVATGQDFAPFTVATFNKYRVAMQTAGLPTNDVKIDESSVQQALAGLEANNLVWRTTRGMYDLEEPTSLKALLAEEGLLEGLLD